LSTVPLPEQFRIFAQGAAKDGATTYDVICRGVADDPDILALLGEAPLRQRRPNLLLASVHFLLLGGTRHPLAAHYDTVRSMGDGEGGSGGVSGSGGLDSRHNPAPGDLVADFRDFCLTQRTELLELLATRSTQTNEVGRCTALLPAFNLIASSYPGRPLSLLDLGTSAGLNLLFDSYAYTYRQRDGGAVKSGGRPEAGVRLECTVRGQLSALPALTLPPVAGRFGIDMAPIDPTSDDGAQWLLACLWPDNLARFTRLREALAIARTTPRPPEIQQGDIVDDLPALVDRIPSSGPLVVFHSWVAAYLSPQRQGELVAVVRDLARGRALHYLYAEASAETPGLPTPPSPSPRPTSHLATALVHLAPDGSPPVRLADMHHHGNWLQWWPTATDPTVHPGEPEPAPLRR
jgi:hypothetical protein